MEKGARVKSAASTTEPARRRIARALLLVALAFQGNLVFASPTAAVDASVARGARLFGGGDAMRGRLEGHAELLPSTASRCINCHAQSTQAGVFAPRLDASTLLAPQRRRGGPPSAYSRDTFCATLRTGIDPAYVTLRSEMPRFDASDEECADLWNYLTREVR
ncbi:hypothetical protein ACV22V_30350 [Burkholderia sp. AW33-5]